MFNLVGNESGPNFVNSMESETLLRFSFFFHLEMSSSETFLLAVPIEPLPHRLSQLVNWQRNALCQYLR